MGELHHQYLMQVKEGLHIPLEVREQEFSLGNVETMYEESPTALGKIDILKQAVLEIVADLDEIGQVLQDMNQREFFGGTGVGNHIDAIDSIVHGREHGRKDQESLSGTAES